MTVDPNQGIDDRRNRRPDRLHHDDRELLENVHADVHHIRKDISEAIERSQSAILNAVSALAGKIDRVEMKIDKLGTPSGGEVVTDADKALMAASVVWLKAVVAKANALDELTP